MIQVKIYEHWNDKNAGMIETRNEDGWFHADYADLKIIGKG